MGTVTRILLVVFIHGLTGILTGPPLIAAAKLGSIAGTLRNEQGQPFPHGAVKVTIPVLTKQRPSIHSDLDGAYKITDLPPGTYTLTFQFMRKYDATAQWGLGRIDCATRNKVVVRAGRQVTVDAVLKYCGDFTYESIRISGNVPPHQRTAGSTHRGGQADL